MESQNPGVQFSIEAWDREIRIGDTSSEFYGLIEVMDNNPLVCADSMSVPGPGATLALIALAPLAQAGLIVDSPVLVLNFEDDHAEIEQAVASVGWLDGLAIHAEPTDLSGVLAATAMVCVRSPLEFEELQSLYEETFGRSFYIRSTEAAWTPDVVLQKPYAMYRLSIQTDHPTSLVTVRVLSDPNGKCGASQVIHAMNVMCGFEESLGVS